MGSNPWQRQGRPRDEFSRGECSLLTLGVAEVSGLEEQPAEGFAGDFGRPREFEVSRQAGGMWLWLCFSVAQATRPQWLWVVGLLSLLTVCPLTCLQFPSQQDHSTRKERKPVGFEV